MNFPGVIQKGSLNTEAVKVIKKELNKILNSTLDVNNGNFGDSTEQVVKQFQKANNLITDGIIGQLTWNKLFKIAIFPLTPSSVLVDEVLKIARSQMNVKEATGKNDGIQVEKYLASVSLGKGFPYCQAFVYWVFNEACKNLKRTNPVPKTAGVLDCFNKAKEKYLVIGTPKPGDQGIMSFGAGKGHTFIVNEVDGLYVHTFEGNTSADPTIPAEDREGQGNFERRRLIKNVKAFLRYT